MTRQQFTQAARFWTELLKIEKRLHRYAEHDCNGVLTKRMETIAAKFEKRAAEIAQHTAATFGDLVLRIDVYAGEGTLYIDESDGKQTLRHPLNGGALFVGPPKMLSGIKEERRPYTRYIFRIPAYPGHSYKIPPCETLEIRKVKIKEVPAI